MPLEGHRLDPWEIARLCHDAGWRDENLVTAVALALAESAGYVRAWNQNDNGSTDRGIWQINSLWVDAGLITVDDCFNPAAATAFAYGIYKGRRYRFTAWSAFTNESYKKFQREGTRGMANMFRRSYGIPFLVEQP